MDILSIPFITPYNYAKQFCEDAQNTPVYYWLLWGKIPENVVVDPSAATQEITASSKNHYLKEVIVNGITPLISAVQIAVGATAQYTIANAATATSSNAAAATAVLTNGVLTITGVAAGTSVITVSDINGDLLGTITATVA